MRKLIQISSLICLLFTGCDESESILENEDLIFKHTYPITIPVFEYTDGNGQIRRINGESSYQGSPDTLSVKPMFTWENMSIRIAFMGIFTEPIQVSNDEITNSSDIIWQWHSGMPTELGDTIQFSEGGNVIIQANGEVSYGPPPPELEVGRDYFWGVWGWGQSGTRVLYSSKELKFHVSN